MTLRDEWDVPIHQKKGKGNRSGGGGRNHGKPSREKNYKKGKKKLKKSTSRGEDSLLGKGSKDHTKKKKKRVGGD